MSAKENIVVIDQTAEPTEQTVENVVSQAVVTNNAGTSGEASEITPRVNDVALEESTSLVESQPVEEESALTTYFDVSETEIREDPAAAVTVVDKNFVFPPGYFKVVERSLPLGSFNLPNTEPYQYPILRLDIANALLRYRNIEEKLRYAEYVRYNLEVELKVLATNYHYGQVMVVWRPSYAPFLKAERSFVESQWMIHTKLSNDPNTGRTCTGPYDTVYTASQLEHHILPVTAGANLTIKLPWTLNHQYVPVRQMMYPQYHIGYLDIYMLTPCAPADIDPPRIQVYGRFCDVVGFGYRGMSTPCETGQKDRIWTNQYFLGDTGAPSAVNAIYPRGQGPFRESKINFGTSFGWKKYDLTYVGSTKSWPWWQAAPSGVGARSSDFDVGNPESLDNRFVEEVEEEIQSLEVDRQQKGGALYKTYNRALSGVNTVATWIGDALAYLGLSKPPMRGVPGRYLHMAPPLSNAVGPDICVSNGFNPESLVINRRGDHSDMSLIENLGKCETFWGYKLFDSANKYIEGPLCPHYARVVGTFGTNDGKAFARTPAGMLLDVFKGWRGSIRYRLHFSSSSFITARFAITVTYSKMRNGSEGVGFVPTQYVEVKGDTCVEGIIPYLNQNTWLDRSVAMANLRVELVDQIVSWKKATSNPIYCSMWISYPGLQVAMPDDAPFAMSIPWDMLYYKTLEPQPDQWLVRPDPIPSPIAAMEDAPEGNEEDDDKTVIEEEIQSAKLPGETSTTSVIQYGMNDFPTSLYHLAKRYSPVYGKTITPFAPCVHFANYGNGRKVFLCTWQPSSSYFASCFRWVRGSYNLMTANNTGLVDKVLRYWDDMIASRWATEPLCLFNNDPGLTLAQLYRRAVTNPHTLRMNQGLIAQRTPFHSNVPFVSGPHVFSWAVTDDQTGLGRVPRGVWWPMCGQNDEWLNCTTGDRPDDDNRFPLFELSYGDDLCYNQWMGVPIGMYGDALGCWYNKPNPNGN